MKRKCEWCGKEYETDIYWLRFCSDECFQAYRYQKDTELRKCEYCGDLYHPKTWNQKYCCQKCFKEAKKIRRHENYLSNKEKCKRQAKEWTQNNKEKNRQIQKRYYQKRREKLPYLIKICPICGKEFKTRKSNKKYCSKECAHKQDIQLSKKFYWNHREEEIEKAKQRYREHKERPKYPCYRYHESRVARIPSKMCLNCNSERCRFDNG